MKTAPFVFTPSLRFFFFSPAFFTHHGQRGVHAASRDNLYATLDRFLRCYIAKRDPDAAYWLLDGKRRER
jgi:hypothetical protein